MNSASGTHRVSLGSDILPPGKELGAYRILAWLASGGIGHVYLADHVKLGRRVALKMLRQEYNREPEIVRRFFAEARAANQVAHENIVQITDFVEDTGDGGYLIMELLDGDELGAVLEREYALDAARAARIMRQVASAMSAVHEVGIVHRDLKPENIFLVDRGGEADFVKLLDFGVAKLASPMGNSRSTSVGVVVGTPAYMSPEQALSHEIDGRADIYAFGVVLFELLTGQLPFEGETLGDFILHHAMSEVPAPSSVTPRAIPTALEALTVRCLAKDPGGRPSSMHEVEAALAALLGGLEPLSSEPESWSAPPPSAVPREKPPPSLAAQPPVPPLVAPVVPRRSRLGLWIGAGATLAAATGAAAFLSIGEPAPAPVAEAASEAPKAAAVEASQGDDLAPDDGHEASPSPAPEPQPTVRLEFTSSPSGATVHRAGARAPLGTTPLTLEVARGEREANFELRVPGRVTASRDVDLRRNASVHLALPPLAARTRAASSNQATWATRRAVIDPFD